MNFKQIIAFTLTMGMGLSAAVAVDVHREDAAQRAEIEMVLATLIPECCDVPFCPPVCSK